MTTITIDRAVVEQALEALTNCNSEHGHRCIRCDSEVDEGGKVAAALRAALAQQAELVVGWMDPASGDVISAAQRVVWNEDFGQAGQRKAALFSVPLRATLTQQDEPVLVQGELPPRYVARSPIQAEPLNLTDPAVQKRLASQWGYVPAAQESVPAAVVGTQSDVWRGYNGQWQAPGEPIKMVQMLRDLPMGTLLYTAPPQRKPLPKHDQHCVDVPGYGLMAVRLVRAVERAHGIKEN